MYKIFFVFALIFFYILVLSKMQRKEKIENVQEFHLRWNTICALFTWCWVLNITWTLKLESVLAFRIVYTSVIFTWGRFIKINNLINPVVTGYASLWINGGSDLMYGNIIYLRSALIEYVLSSPYYFCPIYINYLWQSMYKDDQVIFIIKQ